MKKLYFILSLLIYVMKIAYSSDTELFFLSTQLNPVEEANSMRNVILKNFDGNVYFQPYSDREVFDYLAKNQNQKVDLIGGIYSDFLFLKENHQITNVDNLMEKLDKKIFSKFKNMSKLGTENHYFIPWMQATYIMIANKKALKYLPKKSDINNLTYEELIKWGENITKETGKNKIGFPVGRNGLWHRFLQGYLYPSYTGDMIQKINSKESENMWTDMKKLWGYVKAESLTYNKMDIPLLNEEVWIAWDHTARVIDVFQEKPNEFIAFPAPVGPKGRGYMLVLAGLAVPIDKIDNLATEKLISYLLSEEIQILTMNSVGFFPVVELGDTNDLNFKEIYNAIRIETESSNSLVTILPTGLGKNTANFNSAYIRAFSQIVLRNKNIKEVLLEQKLNVEQAMISK